MRYRVILLAPVCLALLGGAQNSPDLPLIPLINRLDELLQLRLRNQIPGAMGMSRLAAPPSIGKHFQPYPSAERDVIPENSMEREVIGKLEERAVHVRLYLFGTTIVRVVPRAGDYRALKGPAVVTRGTPRPASAAPADPLPEWKAVYPLARRAMQSFQDGRTGFETTLGSWEIVAKPVAGGKRCAMCHAANGPIGGVLYVFRDAKR